MISPDGSTFSGSVNVTIESEDSDYIRYKTNGGAPNCESGTLYSGEFTLSQSATVKAIGCDDAGNGSSIATAEFTKQGGGSSGSKGTRTNKAKGNTPAAPSTQSPIAQGVKDLIEQNRALLTQAESMGIVLPQFIKDILSGATPTGATVRDLTIGSTGTDVTALQNILIGLGHAIPAGATGYFGTQTQSALAAYQSAHGVSPASGYFGALTRAFMKTAGVAGIWW